MKCIWIYVLVSDAITIKPEFQQTAIFLWSRFVPLRLKALASGCCISVRRLEKENKEANHPHIATKSSHWGTLYHSDQPSGFAKKQKGLSIKP